MTQYTPTASQEADASGGLNEAAPFPVLRTFAQAASIRVLSGLAELSYVAGREGDDFTDWSLEADEALIDAFKFERVRHVAWLDTAKAALRRAFEAGEAQREIDQSASSLPERTFAVARAHATIYRDEIDFPDEACTSAIDAAISRVAYKLAERHPISAAEAAHAAIQAFRDEEMTPSIEVAGHALNRAFAGRAERLGLEMRARNREAAVTAALARVLGE